MEIFIFYSSIYSLRTNTHLVNCSNCLPHQHLYKYTHVHVKFNMITQMDNTEQNTLRHFCKES